jgi:hypothetical protein
VLFPAVTDPMNSKEVRSDQGLASWPSILNLQKPNGTGGLRIFRIGVYPDNCGGGIGVRLTLCG